MIFKNKKIIIRHQYTIIELLVVLVIVGLLTGMTVSGIKGALARQGATGAVRTLANKISLAQSFAVSKNRYVALIIPDYNQVAINPDEGYNISDKTTKDVNNNLDLWNNFSSCFVKNRMCYITKDTSNDPTVYRFDRWVDGYEWQTLPSKTVAFISEKSTADKSIPIRVTDVPDPTDPATNPPAKNSTALIFKPSGALVNASQVIIRIFRAAYLAGDDGPTVFRWQGNEDENKGWKIVINGFTGRSRFYLGGEELEN
jgi:Tfp pilus assembly protein FimT